MPSALLKWRYMIFVFVLCALVAGGLAAQSSRAAFDLRTTPAAEASQEAITTVFMPHVFSAHPWTSPFGIESASPFIPGQLVVTRTNELHGGWIRYGWQVSWRNMQPVENGPINWGYLASFEQELRTMRYSGARPLVVLKDSPEWALDPSIVVDGQLSSCARILPDKYDDFANFAKAMVERYKTPEFNVHDWEIGNEPDVDPHQVPPDYIFGCWGDIDDPNYFGGDKFGEMLKVVAPAIKQVDPSAQVWSGGLLLANPITTTPGAGKPERFFRGILASGAGAYIDIVPYHWHPSYWNATDDYDNSLGSSWDALGGGILGKARYLRQIMAEYSVNLPVFLNESGFGCISSSERSDITWCDPPAPDFYQNQAFYLVRTYTRGLSENVMGMIWYTINGPGWRNSGMLDTIQQPRPVYNAFKHMIQRLGSARYSFAPNYGTGIEAYSFMTINRRTDIVWAIEAGANIEFQVPESAFIAAYDLYGNPITATPSGGSVSLMATFSPVFVVRNP